MGMFLTQPVVTRVEVKELSERFQQLSANLDQYLPWASFCRNGGVALTILGAGHMFLKSLSLGGSMAAQLILLGLLMQGAGSCFRHSVIYHIENLLAQFFKIVPNFIMDTSWKPRPLADGAFSVILILIESYSFALCLRMDGFSIWSMLVSILVLVLNGVFLMTLIHNRNDVDLKIICHFCNKSLKAVLRANEEPLSR